MVSVLYFSARGSLAHIETGVAAVDQLVNDFFKSLLGTRASFGKECGARSLTLAN